MGQGLAAALQREACMEHAAPCTCRVTVWQVCVYVFCARMAMWQVRTALAEVGEWLRERAADMAARLRTAVQVRVRVCVWHDWVRVCGPCLVCMEWVDTRVRVAVCVCVLARRTCRWRWRRCWAT